MAEANAAEGAGDSADDGKFLVHHGPDKSVKYPVKVLYCPVCDDWPLEYCEYHPKYDSPKFKEWAEKNLTEEMQQLHLKDEVADEGAAEGDEKKKKRQTRGGKGMIKTKKETAEKERKVVMSRAPRGKKKYVTVVTGLGTFDIDLKKASKFFGSRFACGSSVTGDNEIVIQGDVKDDLWDVIPEKWPEIDEDSIDDLGDQKR